MNDQRMTDEQRRTLATWVVQLHAAMAATPGLEATELPRRVEAIEALLSELDLARAAQAEPRGRTMGEHPACACTRGRGMPWADCPACGGTGYLKGYAIGVESTQHCPLCAATTKERDAAHTQVLRLTQTATGYQQQIAALRQDVQRLEAELAEERGKAWRAWREVALVEPLFVELGRHIGELMVERVRPAKVEPCDMCRGSGTVPDWQGFTKVHGHKPCPKCKGAK